MTPYLLMALQLIPYVVAGVNVIHADLGKDDKMKAAQDAIAVATAGSLQVLKGDNADLALKTGSLVNDTIARVNDIFHHA